MSKFEFDGEKYKQASKHQKEWGNKLISELILNGDEEILDLGCGDGILTEQIALLVSNGKVVGIDASIGMIQTAKKLEKSNLSFICMDIDDIEFEDCFNLIFSNAALHWIKNHQKLLKNTLKALKRDGIIKWNFAGDGTCSNFNDTVKAVMSMPLYHEFFIDFEWPWYMPGRDEYMALFEKEGFRQFEVSYENADRYFQDSDEMVRWIDQPSIVPFIDRIPIDKKEDFRNTVVDRMLDRTRQADGRCFETFRRLNIKAVK